MEGGSSEFAISRIRRRERLGSTLETHGGITPAPTGGVNRESK